MRRNRTSGDSGLSFQERYIALSLAPTRRLSFGRTARAVLTLAHRVVLRALDAPISWFGQLLTVFLLAFMFLLVIPTRGFAPEGWSTAEWIAPGLLAMVTWHTAFASGAFNLVFDRLEGCLEDMLQAPISSFALGLGWVLGAAFTSLVFGLACSLVMLVFLPFPAHPFRLFLWLGSGSFAFASLGILAGLPAKRFDDVSIWDVLIVYPLLMLGAFLGTGARLPPLGALLVDWNPLIPPMRAVRTAWTGMPLPQTAIGGAVLLAGACLPFAFACWRISRSRHIRA